MSDRETLELAAKASGLNLERDLGRFFRVIGEHEDGLACMVEWNPLIDDGDALRLLRAIYRRLSDRQHRDIRDFLMAGTPEGLRRTIVLAAAQQAQGQGGE